MFEGVAVACLQSTNGKPVIQFWSPASRSPQPREWEVTEFGSPSMPELLKSPINSLALLSGEFENKRTTYLLDLRVRRVVRKLPGIWQWAEDGSLTQTVAPKRPVWFDVKRSGELIPKARNGRDTIAPALIEAFNVVRDSGVIRRNMGNVPPEYTDISSSFGHVVTNSPSTWIVAVGVPSDVMGLSATAIMLWKRSVPSKPFSKPKIIAIGNFVFVQRCENSVMFSEPVSDHERRFYVYDPSTGQHRRYVALAACMFNPVR